MDPKIVALLASAGRAVDSFPADFKLGLLTNKARAASHALQPTRRVEHALQLQGMFNMYVAHAAVHVHVS